MLSMALRVSPFASIGLLEIPKEEVLKKLQPEDKILKVDHDLGIAWILLPPDPKLGGFQGISPRIMDEEKYLAFKDKLRKKSTFDRT